MINPYDWCFCVWEKYQWNENKYPHHYLAGIYPTKASAQKKAEKLDNRRNQLNGYIGSSISKRRVGKI